MAEPIIALLTDFGEDDYFVASMKGVIAGINPSVRIIDITHHVPSFHIETAAFILRAAFTYFPKGSIFVTVIDPGVGTARKILLAKCLDYYFIAPDNGVLSLVFADETPKFIREVSNAEYFLLESSPTFEGRDKMAPAAAWLSTGVKCENFGPECVSYIKIKMRKPFKRSGRIHGHILYIDKFGNLITSIPVSMRHDYEEEQKQKELVFVAAGQEMPFKESYGSVEKGELLSLPGSLGLYEIAVREGSAKEKLGLKVGDSVHIQ